MNRKWLRVRGRTWLSYVATMAVLSILTVAAGTMWSQWGNDGAAHGAPWYAETPAASGTATPVSQPSAGPQKADNPAFYAKALSKAFHNAASAVLPAVVAITNSPKVAEQLDEEQGEEQAAPKGNSEQMPFGFWGGIPDDILKAHPELRMLPKLMPVPHMQRRAAVSFGSGVIVDPSGIVLTNNHVVAGGGDVTVALPDGREFKAIDIKTDPKSDLAVLRLKGASNLPAARLGDSNQVEIGDWVVALGQPFNLPGTVTAGIISAKGRSVNLGNAAREEFLQTDAAINPGNSGGPLVNLDGEVVGINTAIASSVGGYQGVGFAIPVNLAKWVGGQLMTAGKVRRAYLGVGIQPVTQTLAEQFKVKVNQGVLVTEVWPDTPAAKAGVKAGDVILTFAGKTVSTLSELQGLVEAVKPGSTESLAIMRDGKPMTLPVKCTEMPANFGLARGAPQEGSNKAETSRFEKLGIQVEDLTPALAEQLGVKTEHGAAITEVRPGSPAALAGLGTGMVITEINHQQVKSAEDFHKALGDKALEKGVLLLVHSAQGSRFVVIRVASE